MDIEKFRDKPETLNFDWVEKSLGRTFAKNIREVTWLKMLRDKRTILIDMPDYSKTDQRLMGKDLDEIYWLWNTLAHIQNSKTNMVIAIQKEMFRGHFFFNKMEKIELKPLKPEQMLEAYMKRFKSTQPFTKDALLTLALMSRGIFRRFLRYITLTLDLWETNPTPPKHIETALVKEAITAERLAEDMELELSELFPKNPELRTTAIEILNLLEEHNDWNQKSLADQLEIPEYKLSRILKRLESGRYIIRERSGLDKIVKLHEFPNPPT